MSTARCSARQSEVEKASENEMYDDMIHSAKINEAKDSWISIGFSADDVACWVCWAI